MINPQSIDLASLPCVELSDRRLLPDAPAIYFAVDSFGVVQYIGRAENLNKRWLTHHRLRELNSMLGIRISYLATEADLLSEVEKALIHWFKPPMNGARLMPVNAPPMKVRKVVEAHFPGLGQAIKKAREADDRSLTQVCAAVGMTTANWYKIESEDTKALPIETLRRIEEILGVNFGVEI